jgi:plasmid stability protein
MATMTIRNLDDQLKQRLRVRAATHGRSMEDEARDILRTALATQPSAPSLIEAIRTRVDPLGGIELDIPAREAIRPAVNLHE